LVAGCSLQSELLNSAGSESVSEAFKVLQVLNFFCYLGPFLLCVPVT